MADDSPLTRSIQGFRGPPVGNDMMTGTRIFLHGLESSSRGTKAGFFKANFNAMLTPDFTGSLDARMTKLEQILAAQQDIVLVGSSFGGLMATIYALQHPTRVAKLILLAPALNFPQFHPWENQRSDVPCTLFIGCHDTVTPPDIVEKTARRIFSSLDVHLLADDHLLSRNFQAIHWRDFL